MKIDFRYHPQKGLRRKGKPLGLFQEADEIRSEDFDNKEDFVLAIGAAVYQLMEDDEELEEEDEDDTSD